MVPESSLSRRGMESEWGRKERMRRAGRWRSFGGGEGGFNGRSREEGKDH